MEAPLGRAPAWVPILTMLAGRPLSADLRLMTGEGHGTVAIMRAVGVSKTTVWRWQEYFAEAGVSGLVKGRSKPPGKKPLAEEIKLRVVEKTMKERPANATHWS